MSMWTHITSCLSVDTMIEDDNILELVKNYLKKAPKITGSEGPADVFVNLVNNSDVWVSCDCNRCEYKKRKLFRRNFMYCCAPNDYECKSGEYATRVVISVQGDLRDRFKEDTEKEFEAFKKYIEKKYIIRDYSVNILED